MAQKKKKGPAPKTKEIQRRKMSGGQIVMAVLGIIMILMMLLGTIYTP